MPRTGMAMERGKGDESDGNSMSRAEKRLEKAQEEIGDEGAGGREEGCIAGASSESRTSAKVRPFRRGRLRA